MRVVLVLAAVAVFAQAKEDWYPCSLYTSTTSSPIIFNNPLVECADISVPLCHEGVCTSSKSISVFVKRIPAKYPAAKPQALWMLQGGPGVASTNMEDYMYDAYLNAKETISVYTMDHRGTGRSTRLSCFSETTISGLSSCLTSLKTTYGESAPAAFSVTNAAKDISYIVNSELADAEVFIYGVSYGTYLVERLMHFSPKSVKGYILDSIQSEIFYSSKDAPYYSNWDRDVADTVDTFLEYCDKDPVCSSKVGPNSKSYLKGLYAQLDNGENKCGAIIKQLDSDYKSHPSWFVSTFLYKLIKSYKRRIMIPAIMYRLNRCNAEDRIMISTMRSWAKYSSSSREIPSLWGENEDLNESARGAYMSGDGESNVLYKNIVLSEIWELPTPTVEVLNGWFDKALMGSKAPFDVPSTLKVNCLFLGSREPSCEQFTSLPNVTFSYLPDKYWNTTAAIPPGTSVLMLAGMLDVATPIKYARDQSSAMAGTNKKLLEFPYSPHGVLGQTPTGSGDCADDILNSYILSHGDLTKVNVDCMARVLKLNFTTILDKSSAKSIFGSSIDIYGPGEPGSNPSGMTTVPPTTTLPPATTEKRSSSFKTNTPGASTAPTTKDQVTSSAPLAASSIVFLALVGSLIVLS